MKSVLSYLVNVALSGTIMLIIVSMSSFSYQNYVAKFQWEFYLHCADLSIVYSPCSELVVVTVGVYTVEDGDRFGLVGWSCRIRSPF